MYKKKSLVENFPIQNNVIKIITSLVAIYGADICMCETVMFACDVEFLVLYILYLCTSNIYSSVYGVCLYTGASGCAIVDSIFVIPRKLCCLNTGNNILGRFTMPHMTSNALYVCSFVCLSGTRLFRNDAIFHRPHCRLCGKSLQSKYVSRLYLF